MFKTILIPGLLACSAFAQTPLPPPLPPKDLVSQNILTKLAEEKSFGAIGITAAMAGPMASIPGAPYSAQAVTQHLQILADGNRITQTTTNDVARDSQGRTRREESLPGFGNGESEPPHLVLIEDQVAGVHITLDSNSKTAMKMTVRQLKGAMETVMLDGVAPAGESRTLFSTAGPGRHIEFMTAAKGKVESDKVSKTDLGTQIIEGVPAKGTKITRTIPAGEVGNEMPIVIETETWFSPDLKVLVMSKSSDPRMGETTYRLSNLSRAEPDPALFQIPADYTIKDKPGNTFFYKAIEK